MLKLVAQPDAADIFKFVAQGLDWRWERRKANVKANGILVIGKTGGEGGRQPESDGETETETEK